MPSASIAMCALMQLRMTSIQFGFLHLLCHSKMVPDSNQVTSMCKGDTCYNAFFSILKIDIYYVELFVVVQSCTV